MLDRHDGVKLVKTFWVDRIASSNELFNGKVFLVKIASSHELFNRNVFLSKMQY